MKYQIWSEGYNDMGNIAGAYFHGEQEAESFSDACKTFFKDDKYFDKNRLMYWTSRLFDNEKDARKLFG